MKNFSVKILDQDVICSEKDFKSGSKGFYGNGKILINDKKYQVGLIITEIGSKPKPKNEGKK